MSSSSKKRLSSMSTSTVAANGEEDGDVEIGLMSMNSANDFHNGGRSPRFGTIQQTVPSVIKRHWPWFIILINLLNWSIFFYGVFAIIGWNNAVFSSSSPLSPPEESWWFITVKWYPDCRSVRHEFWRLISMQFVHEGMMHIGGNTLASVGFGTMFEMYQPYGFIVTFIVYESSVICGTLGHSYLWPFRGLVGCSPGVYGLIGVCWATIITSRDTVDPFILFLMTAAVSAQLCMDIALYLTSYSTNTGYVSHAFGLYTGLTLGLAYTACIKKQKWAKVIGLVGLLAFLLQLIFLVYQYAKVWPPDPYERSFIHNNLSTQENMNCCAQLYKYAANKQLSINEAKEQTYCTKDVLYPY